MFTRNDTNWSIKKYEYEDAIDKWVVGRKYQGERVYLHSDKKIRTSIMPYGSGYYKTELAATEALTKLFEYENMKGF